jgi:signal transduction histidine kinase/DNA-binding response OmpR family regulator
MKFPFSPRVRAGLSLLVLGLVGLSYYLSTTKLEFHITSRVVALVFVLVILIIFVVLPVYSIIVTREIRKRRRVEEALIRAKEEAERASKFKDRFLSTMSHELRTPLNAVLGFSDLLADKRCGELNERQQRYVSHINTGGRHLLKLIGDILDLSKIEAGRMELSCEDLSVANIFGEVVSALRPLAEKKAQTLSSNADRSLAVHADATRCKQVLMNLVGNAIKFTPEGSSIEITAQQADREVQVKVRDNGPGIPREEQKRIFDAFYRLRKSGEGAEGTGLGLAITESLVKLQGGSLGLESEPGHGSCFYFSLPVATAVREPRAQVAKVAQKPAKAPKILIIEDDATTVQLIESQLTSSGYQVVSCDQPERAVEMAAEVQPQAITLDLLMKPTSGWEILLHLKQDPRTTSIPVVVVTVVDNPGTGAALGADEYLVKPVDKATLLAAVERSLERPSSLFSLAAGPCRGRRCAYARNHHRAAHNERIRRGDRARWRIRTRAGGRFAAGASDSRSGAPQSERIRTAGRMARRPAHRRTPHIRANEQGFERAGEKLPAHARSITFSQAGILAGSPSQAVATRARQTTGGKGMKHRILVVEDNRLNSELLRDWLEVEGYEVATAADLNAAFAAVRSQPPNAVLLDIQLGSEDGLSLASWMREQAVLSAIPVIAVTAQAMVAERQHILESGCKSIVSKPVDFTVLQHQLQLCLSCSAVVQENRVSEQK